ncbi:hypothetical protein A1O1_07977 [Capronia coronata CBS 617.96]|uniref:Uncharacterized protein n=1 Tax=Capronia coronata CBS 617.96 TaxID=1182541 RepID=W9XX42_9EURO|nr:uncharacterized protein A1O1_07977 [Capronia coronata CBS 617.96]EXJ81910.1 hypothetical protein A1O1_07977 [Capronia coronata CBS 617.96]
MRPRLSAEDFNARLARYTPEQMNHMHNKVLSHILGDKPEMQSWRLNAADLVCDTPTVRRPPAPLEPGQVDIFSQEPLLATDLTCHLHPTALLLCSNRERRNDKRTLRAVYHGVEIDVIVRLLWRIIYDLENRSPSASQVEGRDDNNDDDDNDNYRQLRRLAEPAIAKYRGLFDERYNAIDRTGGVVVVARHNGTTAEFPVISVDDMDYVPQGGFLFMDPSNMWPSRGKWDMRYFLHRRGRLPPPDPDDPREGLGPLPSWLQPAEPIENVKIPCPYHAADVSCEAEDGLVGSSEVENLPVPPEEVEV